MWKFLLIAVALFVLYKLLTNEKGKKDKDEAKNQERKVAAGEMAKDPICGAYVDVESSVKVRDGNRVQHFCGYDCRQKYLDQLQAQGRDIPKLDSKDDGEE